MVEHEIGGCSRGRCRGSKQMRKEGGEQGILVQTAVLSLQLDVEARAAATATRGTGDAGDLELAPNQLHGVIDGAPVQQLQAALVEDDFCSLVCFEQGVFLGGGLLGQVDQRHEILEAVATAAFEGYSQREVGVVVFGGYSRETMDGARAEGDAHGLAGVCCAGVEDGAGGLRV
jgi:hypothetical protein